MYQAEATIHFVDNSSTIIAGDPYPDWRDAHDDLMFKVRQALREMPGPRVVIQALIIRVNRKGDV